MLLGDLGAEVVKGGSSSPHSTSGRTRPRVLAEPQVRALGTFYRTTHPAEGDVLSIRRPVFLGGDALWPPPT